MEKQTIITKIKQGDLLTLSKTITLCESTLESDQILIQDVLSTLSKEQYQTIRIGITGVPGVGKSSFIDVFGSYLTQLGKKVAVLAIDPSSEKTGGSILGDKSRMTNLAKNKNAFIRPSPAGNHLGGVAFRTKESILLCEAAGFDIILIETVGVGQNETTVKQLADFLLLLMLPNAGDELQGIKRGIMEIADAIIIHKAEADNLTKAKQSMLQYQNALHLIHTTRQVKCFLCSSLEKTGLEDIWENILSNCQHMISHNLFYLQRSEQEKFWLHLRIKEELGNKQYQQLILSGKLQNLENQLLQKKSSIYQILTQL